MMQSKKEVAVRQNGIHLLSKGYVQVYTGNSEGKTTAALGLAFRAMGRGLRTYIGQFMKGRYYGELEAAKMVHPYIIIEQYGEDTFIHVQNPPKEEQVLMAQEGLAKAKKAVFSGEYDVIIFDEVITARYFHLVSLGGHAGGDRFQTRQRRGSLHWTVCAAGAYCCSRPGDGDGRG